MVARIALACVVHDACHEVVLALAARMHARMHVCHRLTLSQVATPDMIVVHVIDALVTLICRRR